MRTFSLILKVIAPVFLLVGALHLIMGPGADVLLGAQHSAATRLDPVLDSQSRFFGVSFTLYGILLYICATDIEKYQVILRSLLWVFFAAGLARLISLALVGYPGIWVVLLTLSELLLPPLLLVWLRKLPVIG